MATPRKSSLTPCAVTGCTRQHARHLMMCLHHWRRVPPAIRKAVYQLYNYGVLRPGYYEVRQQALDAAAAADAREAERAAQLKIV